MGKTEARGTRCPAELHTSLHSIASVLYGDAKKHAALGGTILHRGKWVRKRKYGVKMNRNRALLWIRIGIYFR